MTAPVHDGPPGHGEECSPECPACAVMMAPRRPCAGWVPVLGTTTKLIGGGFTLAYAWFAADYWEWKAAGTVASGDAPTIEAAQLAAEDALLAVRDAITRAVGR